MLSPLEILVLKEKQRKIENFNYDMNNLFHEKNQFLCELSVNNKRCVKYIRQIFCIFLNLAMKFVVSQNPFSKVWYITFYYEIIKSFKEKMCQIHKKNN